jgi:hypothetical protein
MWVNVLAPIRQVRIKQQSSHWFNHEILEYIQARNKAFQNSQEQSGFILYKPHKSTEQDGWSLEGFIFQIYII